MSVIIDQQSLPAEKLGLTCVGDVLTHVQRDNRLVVHLLIDGQEPDLDRMVLVRQSPIRGHTLYIETAEPREMAMDVLDEVEQHLYEADRLRGEACDLMQGGQAVKALERLSGCLSTWQAAQESVLKTAQLLRIDLSRITVDGRTLLDVLTEFTDHLRQIRSALESRDFVTVGDILLYEMTQTNTLWRKSIVALRDTFAEPAR